MTSREKRAASEYRRALMVRALCGIDLIDASLHANPGGDPVFVDTVIGHEREGEVELRMDDGSVYVLRVVEIREPG